MIRDLKVSYIKDREMKVTLTPNVTEPDFIDYFHVSAIFAQVVNDCFIDEMEFLKTLADNLHCQIEIKEVNDD